METKTLKPFDLEKARQGAKVVTRDGRPVRIICWDREESTYPIVALVKDQDGTEEDTETYTLDGACVEGEKHSIDLLMAPTTVERWVNVYKFGNDYSFFYHYDSEQEALQHKDDYSDYVTTTKISWEE